MGQVSTAASAGMALGWGTSRLIVRPFVAVVLNQSKPHIERPYDVFMANSEPDDDHLFQGRAVHAWTVPVGSIEESEGRAENIRRIALARGVPDFVELAPVVTLGLPTLRYIEGQPLTLHLQDTPTIPEPMIMAFESMSPPPSTPAE